MSRSSQVPSKKSRRSSSSRTSEVRHKQETQSDSSTWSEVNYPTPEPSVTDSFYQPGYKSQSSAPREIAPPAPSYGSYFNQYQPRDTNSNYRGSGQMAPTYTTYTEYSRHDAPWCPYDSPNEGKHVSRALEHLDQMDLQFPESSGYIYNRQEGHLRPFERASPGYHDDEDDYYYVVNTRQPSHIPRENDRVEKRGSKQLQEKKVTESKPKKKSN